MSAKSSGLPRWTWLLLADQVVVTAGGQFQGVALPLLMVALWPSPRSYACALLTTLLPQVVLGRGLGRLADRAHPRVLLATSYGVRASGVVGLLMVHSLYGALAALVALSIGAGLYTPAMAHYQADGGVAQIATLLGRLRMAAAFAQAVLPFVAGVLLTAMGRNLGFWVSLTCYLMSGALMAALPKRRPSSMDRAARPRPTHRWIPAPVRAPVLVASALNALGWAANMLYVSYMLVNLHTGAVRYGLSLALWGGAGLASGWTLGRVRADSLQRLSWLWLLSMSVAWLVMTRHIGYWIVALLGLPEGFVTWLVFDLLQAQVLNLAPAAERGEWSAVASMWSTGGRVAGLAAVLVVPVFTDVHAGFLVLALLMGVAALAALANARQVGRSTARRARS